MSRITILPKGLTITVQTGTNLLTVLRQNGVFLDAPCGGHGKCGKCRVIVDSRETLACKTTVQQNMTVTLPERESVNVLCDGVEVQSRMNPMNEGHLVAFDIGTTSVVCFLLDGKTGRQLACSSVLNSQSVFGADVITRIRDAVGGSLEVQTTLIRKGMTELIERVCSAAELSPSQIGVVSVVGNPAMQQIFLGVSPENLVRIPFAPVLTRAEVVSCKDYLPVCGNAEMLIVPDLSGYIGADTLACVLATKMHQADEVQLMVDIGTNGEMVLGNRERMIACSTAAGPALEGANIQFGMRGAAGAIDHVWMEDGQIRSSVIGGGKAKGICGSGLVDAVAVMLEAGLLNKRGRILNEQQIDGQRVVYLTEKIYLTQEDIRQVQMAKGAICAGIRLMAEQLGVEVEEIHRVLLAGAFGNYLQPSSACRIGLLPEELESRITAVGNAAGSGAKLLACDRENLQRVQILTEEIEFLELASLPRFAKTYAKEMRFRV